MFNKLEKQKYNRLIYEKHWNNMKETFEMTERKKEFCFSVYLSKKKKLGKKSSVIFSLPL